MPKVKRYIPLGPNLGFAVSSCARSHPTSQIGSKQLEQLYFRELEGVPFFCFRINISKFPLEGKFGEGNHGICFNEPDRRASSFLLSQNAQPPHPPSKPRAPGHAGFPAHRWELGFRGSQTCAKESISPRAAEPGAGPGATPKQSKRWRSPGSVDPGSPPGEASKSLPGRQAGFQGNLCPHFAGGSPNLPSSKKYSGSNNLAVSDKDLFHLRIPARCRCTLRDSEMTSDKLRGDFGF